MNKINILTMNLIYILARKPLAIHCYRKFSKFIYFEVSCLPSVPSPPCTHSPYPEFLWDLVYCGWQLCESSSVTLLGFAWHSCGVVLAAAPSGCGGTKVIKSKYKDLLKLLWVTCSLFKFGCFLLLCCCGCFSEKFGRKALAPGGLKSCRTSGRFKMFLCVQRNSSD